MKTLFYCLLGAGALVLMSGCETHDHDRGFRHGDEYGGAYGPAEYHHGAYRGYPGYQEPKQIRE